MFKVYLHTCPNGKYYVGQTRNPLLRWNNDLNYGTNRAFYNDIKKYGWENIHHEILHECETRVEAEAYERMFIILLDSENPEHGYNKTRICDDLRRKLDRRYEYIPSRADKSEVEYANTSEDSNPFEVKDIPTSEAEKLIDEWIYNKDHRAYLKERFIDGSSFPDIAKRHGMSVRQIKRVVYAGKAQIEAHI